MVICAAHALRLRTTHTAHLDAPVALPLGCVQEGQLQQGMTSKEDEDGDR